MAESISSFYIDFHVFSVCKKRNWKLRYTGRKQDYWSYLHIFRYFSLADIEVKALGNWVVLLSLKLSDVAIDVNAKWGFRNFTFILFLFCFIVSNWIVSVEFEFNVELILFYFRISFATLKLFLTHKKIKKQTWKYTEKFMVTGCYKCYSNTGPLSRQW